MTPDEIPNVQNTYKGVTRSRDFLIVRGGALSMQKFLKQRGILADKGNLVLRLVERFALENVIPSIV
tara:strand:- start:77 stop:277 length:201 start_codon:yes stop_codon:yes gene_type:complete